ncbi:hypothetical protein D3C81_1421600 [compost metagenome]
MAIGAVLVPVMPAQRLPAPVQVVVVGFIVLVGAGDLRIVAMDAGFPVALIVVRKCRFGQLHHALAMEGHIVLAQPGEGQPWLQHHPVPRKAAIGAQQAKLAHIAVKVAQRTIVAHHGNGRHAAQHGLERNMRIIGQ